MTDKKSNSYTLIQKKFVICKALLILQIQKIKKETKTNKISPIRGLTVDSE